MAQPDPALAPTSGNKQKTPPLAAPKNSPLSRRVASPFISTATVLIVLLLWWLATSGTGLIPPLYFPSPGSVGQALIALNTQIAADAGATLLRVVVSWVGGSTLGVAVGLMMARTWWVMAALNPLIEAIRPIPPVALIPFVILWFGIGDDGKIFLGALACFMVMVVNTTVAVTNVPPVYVQAARSLGSNTGFVYRRVILPAIIPEILSGFRIGCALAFAVVVAAEFLGADLGIGRLIMQASRTLNTSTVLLGTASIAVMAVLLDLLISRLSRYITRWSANR